MKTLRDDADKIIQTALEDAQPDQAVKKALEKLHAGSGRLFLLAVGKAAWQMSKAAAAQLEGPLESGICITKYGHVNGEIPGVTCYEAGHPVPDGASVEATKAAEEMVSNLNAEDTVLFLISGGGSALFEDPLIPLDELQEITRQMLACGADITEINTIRKRLSKVKGGRFAELCRPARVFSIVLSDIVGDPLDMIASGPAYPDSSTAADAEAIIDKYQLKIEDNVRELLKIETPKVLDNVETQITGSVRQLCSSAIRKCRELGYETHFLTSSMICEAREAGSFLASIARDHQDTDQSIAFICGGETVVHLTGDGLGGRNQEIALSAAAGISGLKNTAVFSVGSDGTDGPTNAAGGYADDSTAENLKNNGDDLFSYLARNDSYHALKRTGGLIFTGPTGTNVNDLTVVLIKR